MKFIIPLLFSITLFNCQSQSLKYEFENQLSDCIYKKYDSLKLDFKGKIVEFENYLLQQKVLTGKKGTDYQALVKKITTTKQIFIDFGKFEGLKDFSPQKFSECVFTLHNTADLNKINPQLRKLIDLLQSIQTSQTLTLRDLMKSTLDILSTEDYECEFYRNYVLVWIHLMSYQTLNIDQQIKMGDSQLSLTNINIYISDKNEVFVDNTQLPMDSVSNYIIARRFILGEKLSKTLLVKLEINRQARVWAVQDLKLELKEADSKDIDYRFNKD